MESLAGFLPFVLIALVFWLFIVRPQRRRQHQLSATQSSLAPGAEVMLGSGIYGTVSSVEDETVHLELTPGTTVKVARQAVVRVLEGGRPEPDVMPGVDPATEAGDPGAGRPGEQQ